MTISIPVCNGGSCFQVPWFGDPQFQRLIVVSSPLEKRTVPLLVRRRADGYHLVQYMQAFTGAQFDFVAFNGVNCSSLVSEAAGACFAFQYCATTPTLGVIPSRQNTEMYNTSFFPLLVTFGQAMFANPLCADTSAVTAGIVMSDVPFIAGPVYRYFVQVAPTFPINSIIFMNSTTHDLGLWLRSRGGWSNASADAQLSALEPNVTIQSSAGDMVDTSLVLFAVDNFNESITPSLSKSTAASVHCSIRDVSSFSRQLLLETMDLGALYNVDCSDTSLKSNVQQQLKCVGNVACVGYVTTESNAPLCLLYVYGGHSVDPFAGLQRRWLMLKASDDDRT